MKRHRAFFPSQTTAAPKVSSENLCGRNGRTSSAPSSRQKCDAPLKSAKQCHSKLFIQAWADRPSCTAILFQTVDSGHSGRTLLRGRKRKKQHHTLREPRSCFLH